MSMSNKFVEQDIELVFTHGSRAALAWGDGAI